MGEVYLAERQDGEFDQRVAVKLLRPLLPTPDLVPRFRAERQILARLAHPLIVPLLDGGVTGDGRPYLVMQYVDGAPITEHCDRAGLGEAGRLRLLAAVCRAVQHAHANLVVHRDLKPSNILVSADGEPRLLDFGIAKLLAGDGDGGGRGEPDLTRPHLRWATPERAAPEQLAGGTVTTATDVYGLGALLVEMITGSTPGRDRSTHGLTGDLGRIAAKALAADPEQRYSSAGQLGEELERYLAGRPVIARPDRWTYRAAKLLRRNRLAAAAVATALVALVAFAVTSALSARRIAAERDRATAEEARARQVLALLVDLFETADPRLGGEREAVPVSRLLADAEQRVAGLADDPELRARMLQVLGRIRLARSELGRGRELLERARAALAGAAGPGDPLALELELDVALALESSSRLTEAEASLRSLLPRVERHLGREHPLYGQVLGILSGLTTGAEREAMAQERIAIERARRPPDPLGLAAALGGLASHRLRSGDLPAAEPLFREAAELYETALGPDASATQQALTNLATSLSDLERQEALYRRLIELGRRTFGDESQEVANRLTNLGWNLGRQGARREAEAAFSEAAEIWRRIGGEEHWRIAVVEHLLARVLALERRHEEALALAAHAAELARAPAVGDPWLIGRTHSRWSDLLRRSGRHGEALAAASQAVDHLERADASAAARAEALLALGRVRLALGEPEAAAAPLESAAALLSDVRPARTAELGEVRCALGRALAADGRREEAATAFEAGLAAVEGWPLLHPDDLADCRAALGSGSPLFTSGES